MKERAPYKYLDYYTFEDADLFFGREEETQKMIGEILSTRLLVLFSPSGSGKTSLINAGVVPELKRRGYETLYVRFESDPLTSLQNAAREQLQHAGAANDLPGLLQNVTAARKKPLVVFLDQFEEFFLVFADQPALRQDFIAQIASVKYDEQLPVFLVLSLREDYYASLHEFRSAIPSIFQNNANIRLGAFTDEEAKRAILLPLAAVGLQMEAGLAEKIIHDLKPSRNGQERREDNASGIEPITLQIVCHKLWQMKPKDVATLTAGVYEKCGGAQKILRHHVSELLQKIPQRQQGLMVRIFEALKTRDNTKLYRRLQDLQETLRLTDSRRLKNALQKLAEIGMLRHEQRSGDDWYEFKHDYLVPEMTKWIQARRERINRQRLWYVASPGMALLLGLLLYLFVQYNSFYLGTVTPENLGIEEEEIAIFRENPFHQVVVTTGFLLSDARDDNVRRTLKNHFTLGFQKDKNWNWLLETVKGEKVLYRFGEFQAVFGEFQAAIEALLDALKDSNEDVRSQAVVALGKIKSTDPAVIKALLDALKDSDYYVRSQAAVALGEIKSTNPAVIKALHDALKDSTEDGISHAAFALVKLGQTDPGVIKALLETFRFGRGKARSYFRHQAAAALDKLGQTAPIVIKALLDALKDSREDVRSDAATALGEIKSTDPAVIKALHDALKDPDMDVCSHAAVALVKLGQTDPVVIKTLLDALKDSDEDVRSHAAAALVKLGQTAPAVIKALLDSLKGANWNFRSQVAVALGKLGQTGPAVIKALLDALKDSNKDVRSQAAAALGKLGQTAPAVIKALLDALKDSNEDVRSNAAAALGRLGQINPAVIKALLDALKDSSEDIRSGAAAVLGEIKSTDPAVIKALLNALKVKDSYFDVPCFAAVALVKLGQIDPAVIKALIDELKFDKVYHYQREDGSKAYVVVATNLVGRSQAAAALGEIKPTDPAVIKALLDALKDGDEDLRPEAAIALGKIKPTEPLVIKALLNALKDSFVRSQAAAALGNLLKSEFEADLLELLSNNLSGYRTAGVQALARQDSLSPALLNRIDQLRQNENPWWVRLAASDAYKLIQARLKSEAEAKRLLHDADSTFASNQFSVASDQYETAFEILKDIIRLDSTKTAYTKFQQARCAAKLKRIVSALDDLKIALEYHPTWRETLQVELAHPNNDWAILQGNWYLREVLLKKR